MKLEPEIKWAAEEKRARDFGSFLDDIWAMPLRGRSGAPSGLSRCASQAKPPAAIAKGENE